jgi:hypothetical protein
MKIKNPETGEVIVIPQGMEDAVRDAIESGNDPMEAMQMKYGGIHINPANKGKFNATKKATGKTTEELTHSKNPLTRKRAIFAQNASRWKHQDGGQAMQQQQTQGGGQQDQMQQLIQMVEQALAQGTPPEEVAQMLIQQGVPEQVVQQVIQYAIQDLQQQQQAQGQNPQEEQMQQQNPQEEQAEMRYGGMSMYDDGGMAMYGNGGGIDNPGFRALPAYVQQDIINNMRTGGKFLRKAVNGIYDDNQPYTPEDATNTNSGMVNNTKAYDPNANNYNWNATPNQFSKSTGLVNKPNISKPLPSSLNININPKPQTLPSSGRPFDIGLKDNSFNERYNSQNILSGKSDLLSTHQKPNNNKNLYNYSGYNVGGSGYFNRGINHLNNAANSFIEGSQNKRYGGLHRMDIGGLDLDNTNSAPGGSIGGGNIGGGSISGGSMGTNNIGGINSSSIGSAPGGSTIGNGTSIGGGVGTSYPSQQNGTPSQKPNGLYKWAAGIGKAFSDNNVDYGIGAYETTKGIEDLSKGTVEIFGNNISNRNALGDEANNLRSAMRNDYQRTGKRPTDGNAIISKYGGRMMQDGGATYADKMKVSKDSPEADFIAEKGEYIVNNGVASKLETGGSHASGNDTAISLDKSSNPSYVLSDTPRLKQLQFGGKRVSPSKYAEMATVEALGKTPDQILKAYTAFTKRAGTEGKVFGDRISDSTNQLLAQKYQKDLATVKQIADQAYHKQEQLKHAMGMDNDLDHAQEVNGMSMAKSGGMQDGVHMNYFNAPAVQYGGSPQLFSDPSELGYNTTQMAYGGMPMAYGGLHKMQNAGKALNTTRQQSQIDYDKQYGVKTNTGYVGVDKYADMQNKSKIGFGNAEQNLKSFSQWRGIYPGYDDLMKEVNKPGGPGKENPKVGYFQKWFNNDYIPQQIEKLNTERTAAGYPAYDATQLAQLKTDLINDYGFDDTTGQRTDSDFGAFTSSRTPLNFSFNKKKEEETPKDIGKGDEVELKNANIEKEKERPTYDIPPANFYIPQSYGRNPIGLALAQPQTIRPAKLNIQPELNEYNRGIRGAFRGTQGNTSVDVAQQMQGLNNLYGAQNKLYGQKYNFDEQSRMGAEQFNAQAIMNTDAANIQRIGVNQDAIARREGAIDTQRRTDFQAGIENADKQNAYGLSKEYIEDTFAPYLNNQGKLNFTYDPRTGEKINKDKEKTYTRAEYDKMIADEKNATKPIKYGGSLKKIKLKLRK